jgi:hypothetical protein
VRRTPALVAAMGGYLFAVSASAHLACAHGPATCAVCFACDKASIAAFFWSCSVASSVLYFRRLRFPTASTPLRAAAFVVNTVSCAVASVAIARSSFGWKMTNGTKVQILASQVFGGLVPAILEVLSTKDRLVRWLIVRHASLSLGWAGAGAAFFMSFFPEKHWPGVFDKAVYSHGMMHVCVALSVVEAFLGYERVFRRTFR